jgi:hypothetical protein
MCTCGALTTQCRILVATIVTILIAVAHESFGYASTG